MKSNIIIEDTVTEVEQTFGEDVVKDVMEMMYEVGDPDFLYIMYEDRGMYSHMECVSVLYFE